MAGNMDSTFAELVHLILVHERGHSLKEVAELLGMTPSAFSRFFRRATGRTFVDYLGALRIAHACELLVETDLPVLQISLAAGFNNLSNFNRRFRRLKGMTPGEYRRQVASARE